MKKNIEVFLKTKIYYNFLKVCKDIIFRSSEKYNFVYLVLCKIFFTHIKMSKDSLVKYYEDKKKDYKKKLMKDTKTFIGRKRRK